MIASRGLPVGTTKLVRVNYRSWLDCKRGETITNVTATVIPTSTPATTAGVSGLALTPDKESVMFYISGGMANDTFNIQVTITTSLGQIRPDLIGVSILPLT